MSDWKSQIDKYLNGAQLIGRLGKVDLYTYPLSPSNYFLLYDIGKIEGEMRQEVQFLSRPDSLIINQLISINERLATLESRLPINMSPSVFTNVCGCGCHIGLYPTTTIGVPCCGCNKTTITYTTYGTSDETRD